VCGIAGFYGVGLPNPDRLKATLNAQRHRGPDGDGFFMKKMSSCGVALTHNRLAIIDLETRSDQPFYYDESSLVFNGEIYNYSELRQELEGLGHCFSTNGDTEVLAHALREWGTNALNKFEGMWAFAWFDEKTESLLLSRDRFGEKPLFIWKRNEQLYFASEIKGLATMAGEWPALNQTHLLRYLINGYKSLFKVQESFYIDVEELPRASYLLISTLNIGKPTTYWQPERNIIDSMSYEDAVDATKEALIASMGLRLRADVPLAFCMSGGVDSNSLISIAKRIYNHDVHGFTIMNTDKRYEESSLVEHATEQLRLRHTPIYLQSDHFLENLKSLVLQHDAPISTISFYVHSQLMRAVSLEGYKISISGTAADELFSGYYDHHNLFLYEAAKNKNNYHNELTAWQQYQAKYVRNPYLRDPNLFLKNPSFREHIFLNNSVFSDRLKTPWKEEFSETYYDEDLLRNRMLNELFCESVPVSLREDDLNAMKYSVENRSPFLDSTLFETAYSIPTRHLIKSGRTKSVLRDSMRGIVPDLILDNRRKVGFNAPIDHLLNLSKPDVRASILDDSPIYDIVKKTSIENLVNQSKLPNSESKYLFNFLNAKMFLEAK